MFNVIFLDMHGVMLRSLDIATGKNKFAREAVIALNRIIEQADAHIVVSSTYREYGARFLEHYMIAQGVEFARVLGVTEMPEFNPEKTIQKGKPRSFEIASWLTHHSSFVHGFLVLDDDEMENCIKPHSIVTNYQTGLTVEHIEAAVHILNERKIDWEAVRKCA